jgi:hypothetical protein
MDTSDLFSHPYEPESTSNTARNSEPVNAPVFSDSPHSDSTQEGLRHNSIR